MNTKKEKQLEPKKRILRYQKILLLHLMLLVYSLGGVLTKKAGEYVFFSVPFFLCYGGVLAILALYAVVWQQIINILPLTTAFANKAITTAWGLLWGVLFFQEQVSWGKIVGVSLIIIGIVLFARASEEE